MPPGQISETPVHTVVLTGCQEGDLSSEQVIAAAELTQYTCSYKWFAGAAGDGAAVVHVPDQGAQAPHEPPRHHLLPLDEVEENQVRTHLIL